MWFLLAAAATIVTFMDMAPGGVVLDEVTGDTLAVQEDPFGYPLRFVAHYEHGDPDPGCIATLDTTDVDTEYLEFPGSNFLLAEKIIALSPWVLWTTFEQYGSSLGFIAESPNGEIIGYPVPQEPCWVRIWVNYPNGDVSFFWKEYR